MTMCQSPHEVWVCCLPSCHRTRHTCPHCCSTGHWSLRSRVHCHCSSPGLWTQTSTWHFWRAGHIRTHEASPWRELLAEAVAAPSWWSLCYWGPGQCDTIHTRYSTFVAFSVNIVNNTSLLVRCKSFRFTGSFCLNWAVVSSHNISFRCDEMNAV